MRIVTPLSALTLATVLAASACADISVTLSPGAVYPGGLRAINFSGEGSGTITDDATASTFFSFKGFTFRGFDAPFLNPYDFDNDILDGKGIAPDDLTGSLTNLTSGESDTLRDFRIYWPDEFSDQAIDFRYQTPLVSGSGDLDLSAGDEFSLNFSGVITPTGVGFNFIDYSDLIPGVYTTMRDETPGLPASELNHEVFGTFTLTILPVPEPSTIAIAGIAAVGLAVGCRRRS